VGAATHFDAAGLVLEAVVLDPAGRERLTARGTGDAADALALGSEVADTLLRQGAGRHIGR
jgi:hypothetical protein